ncbi:MAG TPA: hypothetical protein VFS92_10570 [Planctomycetota bacterium]|nr:hypothetical protein [Planctomycetota bacterium]
MKRLAAPLGVLLAVAILALLGWLLLGGESSAAPTRPAPPPPRPREPEVRPPPPPDPDPDPAPDPEPAPAPDPDAEAPLPLDAYPWEVPPWWHEHEKKLRETEVEIYGERLSIPEILERVGKDAGVPTRVGRELEGWASATLLSSPSLRGPARGIVEALAVRYNLEPHLTRQGLVLHQRGRAPANRLVQAGRVQWALSEARERKAGRRPAEPDADLARGMAVAISFSKTPLRQAAETIHDRTGVPVYLDATLWTVNPAVTLEPGKATLGEALDAMLEPLGAASDVNPRRIVIFR